MIRVLAFFANLLNVCLNRKQMDFFFYIYFYIHSIVEFFVVKIYENKSVLIQIELER